MHADDETQQQPAFVSLSSRLDLESPPEELELLELTAPVEETEESGPAPSLLDRLWSTKVVAWEGGDQDADAGTVEEELEMESVSDDGDAVSVPAVPLQAPTREGEGKLRTTALFVISEQFAAMDTRAILSAFRSTRLRPPPFGLEWVDDSSVVVLFRSEQDSAAAFQFLTSTELDVSAPLEYLPLVASAEPPFTSTVHLRMALGSDVKQKDAAAVSKFYQAQRSSRASRSKPYDRPSASGPWTKSSLDDELDELRKGSSTKASLDDDLDRMVQARQGDE